MAKTLKQTVTISLFILYMSSICYSVFGTTLRTNVYAAEKNNLFTIVIDAGHGGKDPGAVNGKIQEKDINLAVALKLGGMLEKTGNIKVVYTRKTDVFVDLSERTNISNRANANLFVSIHTNASKNASARGIETYVMGMEKEDANLNVAMRENGVITLEDDYSSKYEGYDPSSAESYIIFSLQQNAYQNESLKLAGIFQEEYMRGAKSQMLDKGVKQANFLVLWKTAAPSVLTEIGFISNANDRAFITSDVGKLIISKSIFNAVTSYIDQYRKGSQASKSNVGQSSPKSSTGAPVAVSATVSAVTSSVSTTPSKSSAGLQGTSSSKSSQVSNSVYGNSKGATVGSSDTNPGSMDSGIESKVSDKSASSVDYAPLWTDNSKTETIDDSPASSDEEPRISNVATSTVKSTPSQTANTLKSTDNRKTDKATEYAAKPGLEYHVQILATKNKVTSMEKNFGRWSDRVLFEKVDDVYKYYVSAGNVYQESLSLQDKLRVNFPDCFVVPYFGRQRITISEARKLEAMSK